jgi:transposase
VFVTEYLNSVVCVAPTSSRQRCSATCPEQRVPANYPLRKIREITDQVLQSLSGEFGRTYSRVGWRSIPPGQLCRALLLQVLYTIRSERMLMEQLEYNLLCRWFVGLNMDDPVWDVMVFTKNRERFWKADIATKFFARVVD